MSVAVFATATVLFAIDRTPSFRNVRARYLNTDQLIVDRNGQVLNEIKTKGPTRRLGWVSLKDVPADFLAALLMAEDKRFFYHPGVDPSGGDTVTMQVVDFISREGRVSNLRRMARAVLLEIKWRKSEIIETYLNLLRFRGELEGLAAASYGLFDKPPARLRRTESALLVALVRESRVDSPRVRNQACEWLRRLGSPEDCALLTLEHLGYLERGYNIQPFPRLAPHLADRLAERSLKPNEALVQTTLDRRLQWQALHALQTKNAEGAVVIIDNASGDILAYVGKNGSKRQPAGSALIPLIFAGAIDERILTVSSLLEDSPRALEAVTFGNTDALYRSRRQPVSTARALIYRLKIPAVLGLELLGVDNFVQMLAKLGFRDLSRPDTYGPSLALGSAEVNLLELTNAYRTLTNGGIWTASRFSKQETSEIASTRVLSPATAFIVKDLLSRRYAEPRDHWSVGFSADYTVGVFTEEPGRAEAVYKEIVRHLPREAPDVIPQAPPEGLVREGGAWYLAGTEPGLSLGELTHPSRSHFSFPRDQGMVALDGSSSKAHQRFFIQVVAPKLDQNVYLNGRRLGRAASFLPWRPVAGRHLLELRNSKGMVLDRVTFEVRGRSFASAG